MEGSWRSFVQSLWQDYLAQADSLLPGSKPAVFSKEAAQLSGLFHLHREPLFAGT